MALLSLGMFVFALDTLPYNDLARKVTWRIARSDRLDALPAAQFLGPAEETVTISGLLAPPEFGSYGELRMLEELGGQGEALPLVSSEGIVMGRFTIESIDERQGYFLDNGVPRRKDFTIELKRAS